jgi:hypothetical protein
MSFAVSLQIELLRPPTGAQPATDEQDTRAASPAATLPSKAPTPGAEDAATGERSSTTNANAWRWYAGIGPALALGSAPAITGQGRIFGGAQRGQFSLELGAEGTLAVTERMSDGSGFTQQLIGGSAMPCRHLGIVVGCVIGKASQLRVSGLTVDEPRSPTALVLQAGARLGARLDLSSIWWIKPHVDVLGVLTPRTVALNQQAVWELPALSALVGIDLAGRFP